MSVQFAFASRPELRAAKRLPRYPLPMGVGYHNRLPKGRYNSGGYAGATVNSFEKDGQCVPLTVGTVVTASHIIRLHNGCLGRTVTLHRCEPIKIPGAVEVTVVAVDRVIDDLEERDWLYQKTGAEVMDMETGRMAEDGTLHRYLRVISDTPKRRLNRTADVLEPNGQISLYRLGRAVCVEPGRTLPTMWHIFWNAELVLRKLSVP